MGFFDSLNSGVDSLFKELSKSKRLEERRRNARFNELERTSWLFSSVYLDELSEGASKEEYDLILDYLYRFNNLEIYEDEYLNILEVESYRNIESKIIDRLWS